MWLDHYRVRDLLRKRVQFHREPWRRVQVAPPGGEQLLLWFMSVVSSRWGRLDNQWCRIIIIVIDRFIYIYIYIYRERERERDEKHTQSYYAVGRHLILSVDSKLRHPSHHAPSYVISVLLDELRAQHCNTHARTHARMRCLISVFEKLNLLEHDSRHET